MRHQDYFFNRHINKLKIRTNGVISSGENEDISIIIGVKNRCDYRIVNSFKSLRCQNYDSRLLNVVLVDYDSDRQLVDKYKEICDRFSVKYLRIENKPLWNKSHCLNIAIRQIKTKYLCSSDVDVFFEKNYISECIKELQRNPYQVLLSSFYNTPNGLISSEIDVLGDYDRIKGLCGFQVTELGLSGALNPGVNLSLSCFYKAINGYDEYYTLWGSEDFDLIKRFSLLGLNVKDVSKKCSWVHQAHEKHEGVNTHEEIMERIKMNKSYLNNTHSIVRNISGWGL